MKRKKQKILLTILMIITVLATDFFVLSSGIKTYASQLNSETNNPNIEFSAYFKEGENRVDSIEKSIKVEDLRLYAEIKVKKEGYLKEDSIIGLENSNFNLKSEILQSNTHVKSIKGNKVSLKQINSDETVEIEIGIEPIITDKITTDFLSRTTTVKMIGSYVYSKSEEGQPIRTDKWVSVNYMPDETTKAELETNIITNKIVSVDGTNQRIVQVLVKSRLADNEYPVEQTILNISVPNLGENEPEVTVLELNETTKIKNTTTENGLTKIILSNEPDENNEISWNKNVWDEVVVTYIYPETVDANKIEITTDSEVKVYDSENTYKETHTTTIENQEPNNVIMGKTEITTEELYKGNLYAKIEEQYNTKTSIIITNAEVSDKVVVHEGPDTFGINEREVIANTKYITTEINLEKLLNILGQDGSIEIKNGETTTNINKDTEVNESGNVVINYENRTAELEIITSKPLKSGILELKHTKAITENNYTRPQLQIIKTLNARNTTSATLKGTKIVENTAEPATLELKETISKAELSIENNKKILSTTEENELTLGITLVTNGKQYDLYKNPKMSIKFPKAVTNVELMSEPNKQNLDEFSVEVGEFNTTNKTVQINLSGEQTIYPEAELTQGYIQLNLKVTLDRYAISQVDEIKMAYANENASQYEGGTTYGIVKQEIQISAPSQLIKMYNVSSSENTSLTETILQRVKEKEAGKNVEFGINLINNKDSDIRNLKILGKLPTTENSISGQGTNTLETKLKEITAENAKIYYTENTNAKSTDIENEENGWTENLTENAKMYLIKVDTLERGAQFTATITEQLPNSIAENGISYSQYGVIYDTATETGTKEVSRKIGLASSEAANIKAEITAQVGQDILKSGDVVKEGEVIKYTVTVKNTGTNTLENLQFKLDVPEGTTYVQPRAFEDYKYELNSYYEEITDSEKLVELTNLTIPQIKAAETYTIQYEVRVNKSTANTEISNKSVILYNGTEVRNLEFNNIIKEAQLKVTIESAKADGEQLIAGGKGKYKVYIENVSDSTINNLELQIISKDFSVEEINGIETTTGKIQIDKIVPKTNNLEEAIESDNGIMYFEVYGKINESIEELNISAIVKDSEGEIYRSNLFKEDLAKVDATISMSSPQEGKYLKEGDKVEYNIIVKNIGETTSEINVIDNIDEYLEIQEINLNGELIIQKTDKLNIPNDFTYILNLEPKEQGKLDIIAQVRYIPEMFNGKAITNMATINISKVKEMNSQIITNILKANLKQDQKIENIITGFAWFDENANGRRDVNEETLSGINVKIFDLSTNRYIKDEYNNPLSVSTDETGTYTFLNIEEGSYLVVFEYDTQKYVLTTAFAKDVDYSINSKAIIKTITGSDYIARVAAIELQNMQQNVYEMNIGLKENTGDTPIEEQPGIEKNPDNPETPKEPDMPVYPETPVDPENPINTKTISGFAWLDSNMNGKKDTEESYLSGIKVRLYNVSTKKYLTYEDGKIVEILTDNNGKYEFTNIENGSYILLFEYDNEEYKFTTQNSNLVLKKVTINGQEKTVAVTNTIKVQNNVSNINIGLSKKLKFDLELNKYISKIVVQTSKETKTYDYQGKTLGKVEIHRKQIQGANVILEYTIKVKNNGEIAGYAKNIVDYLPSGMKFSSELNKDWYLVGNYLYTKSLKNIQMAPGEEKEVKLILTKTMTSQNVGLINNRAEIYQDYNNEGELDIDSTPNNQAQNEDDFGTTDVIIQIATGGSITAYIVLAIINIILIFFAIRIMIVKNVIKIKLKKGGRGR